MKIYMMQLLVLTCLGVVSVVTPQNTYCGRRLAAALDYICDGHLIKRSEPKANDFEPNWPWIAPTRAFNLGYRFKRQVVAECCDKPCTVDELMTYCGI